jgi:hypothetical protein
MVKKMKIDLSKFSIYKEPLANEKRLSEAKDIMLFLQELSEHIPLDDVKFALDPPDFIFCSGKKQIGVELTKLNPKKFESGGYKKRGEFKAFEAERKQEPFGESTFPWGEFTHRESLEALTDHLNEKREKARSWQYKFSERWLLMAAASGSPFGEIVAKNRNMKALPPLGAEIGLAEYLAQITYNVYKRCVGTKPFDYIILFFRDNFLAFPTESSNPHHLPTPSGEILKRGASVPDSFLDRKRRIKTTIRTRTINFGSIHSTLSDSPFA